MLASDENMILCRICWVGTQFLCIVYLIDLTRVAVKKELKQSLKLDDYQGLVKYSVPQKSKPLSSIIIKSY